MQPHSLRSPCTCPAYPQIPLHALHSSGPRRHHAPAHQPRQTRASLQRRAAVHLDSGALQTFLRASADPAPGLPFGLVANTVVFTLGYGVLRKGLTPLGVAHAWVLGASVCSAFGLKGYALVCLYFLLGTLVTKVKLKQKQSEGIAEARSGQRGPASVWGSGLAAVACAVASMLVGDTMGLCRIGFVASICSKLSDTVSSEIGKAYGKSTFLITSFERVPRGTEGAVSMEGTLAGVGAAVAFSALALALAQVDAPSAAVVCAAAVAANTLESYLGAVVQSRVEWLTNDVVNMLQISVAAALAMAAKLLLL